MIDHQLIAELRRDEGVVSHAYQDSLGFWTIGVGRLVDRRRGGGLSEAEIDLLLSNDVERVQAAVEAKLPWSRGLSPARRRVLLNLAFNLGVEGLLGFRRTLKAVDVMISAGALSAVYGIVQYGIFDFDNLGQRVQGTLGHYMTYSGLIMLVACVAAARTEVTANAA